MRVLRHVLGILLMASSTIYADIGPAKLETLIEGSDLVVLGKVSEIKTLDDGFRVATVEVIETLRGSEQRKTLYYIASHLTPEDVSDAKVGDAGVLFLRKPQKPVQKYPDAVRKITHDQPLFFIAHAGRGRLIPVKIDADNYVHFRRDRGILLPLKLSASARQDANDPSLLLLRLDDLLNFIKQYR